MRHAKVLDCTLRDGAYLLDKKFGDVAIRGIIKGLLDSRIDLIEIGFLQNEEFGEGKTVYLNAGEAECFVPTDKKNSMFTVLADYSRYNIENLEPNNGRSFDAVRACFFKKERYDVIDFCKQIKNKGYKVFIQPVDILGYADEEIIELLHLVSAFEPYCFSIVDTFGSMYEEDLERIVHLINHNLAMSCRIGFHSHNNMQMSNALTQAFLRMTFGQRQVIIDSTMSGMGRGAGNTPTELVVQYMVSKLGYSYNMDAILDVIDTYMPAIRAKCSWGYSTPYFIAGCYSAHVNNITYLTEKNCVDSKGIRYILNKIGALLRKRYDYDLLERTYLDYLSTDVDDTSQIERLLPDFRGKDIMLIAPGASSIDSGDLINAYKQSHPELLTVAINHISEIVASDYLFISNITRHNYWKNDERYSSVSKIFTSNLRAEAAENDCIISYQRLIKCGWENMENSAILLLRLLDVLGAKSANFVGFDGYEYDHSAHKNYAIPSMELSNAFEKAELVNRELQEMLDDFIVTKKTDITVSFITPSRFFIR